MRAIPQEFALSLWTGIVNAAPPFNEKNTVLAHPLWKEYIVEIVQKTEEKETKETKETK